MARPPITAKGEALFRKQLEAALDYIESLSGGATAWGGITGTLSSQTDLQSALDGKAASSHTHTASQVTDFSEAVDDRVSALLVAGANITLTYDDGANTLTIDATSGGGGSSPAVAWVI